MKTLDQWLKLLETRHPVEIELGLERISTVARRLGITRPAARVVTVGGTNGKGSCVKTLEALAMAQGLRVGTYTSPHLMRYNERVRVCASETDDNRLCEAFETIDLHREETPLTYFEVGTLAALLILSASELDLAVLEVGLGGRYDAVNIVDPDVAVITSIALDHMNWLGDDRETIALEKAGIARAGIPVIVADPDPPRSLTGQLETLGAASCYLDRDFCYRIHEGVLSLAVSIPEGGSVEYRDLPVPALPVASVSAAVQAMHCLGWKPDPSEPAAVLRSLRLAGRFQRIPFRGRELVLDVAHNPAAASYLAGKLKREPGPVHAVTALMADKDVAGFIDQLAAVVDHWHVGNLSGVERALDSVRLAALLADRSLPHNTYGTIEAAFEGALAATGEKNTLVVCGSFFTISAIVKSLGIGDDL